MWRFIVLRTALARGSVSGTILVEGTTKLVQEHIQEGDQRHAEDVQKSTSIIKDFFYCLALPFFEEVIDFSFPQLFQVALYFSIYIYISCAVTLFQNILRCN